MNSRTSAPAVSIPSSPTAPAPVTAAGAVDVSPQDARKPTEAGGRRREVTALSLSQIVDATAACLAESGYDGTTIRRIANRLDCAVGSIYRYCSDKRSLLSAVTQRRFEPVAEAIDDHVSVVHTAGQYAIAAANDPQQYRLMFWLASMEPDTPGDALPAIVGRIIEGWTRQVGDPRLAQRVWMQVHSGVMVGMTAEAIQNQVQAFLESRGARPGRVGGAAPATGLLEPQDVG